MEEWKEYKLGDCVEAVIDNRGKSAPTKPSGEFPLLEINSIGGYYPNYSVIRKYVDKVTYNTWFRSGHPICGDILIPTVGTIGIISIMDNHKACIAQNLIALRTKKEISNIFIYYFLKSPIVKKQLINLDIGGVQPSIKVPHLLNLSISLPEKDIQHKIASILSSLDDKIEVNRKINENLEQQAQALFKSWFVDFEPFKNGEFVESELGMIPKGWRVTTLDNMTSKFGTGLNPRKNFKLGEGDNYYVTIKNMGNNRVYLDEKCDKVNDEAIEKINKRSKLQKGDLLFSGIGTIGRVALITETPTNWNTSESVFNLHPSEIVSSEFLYILLLSDVFQQYVKLHAQGGVQQGIRMASLKEYKMAIPKYSIMREFDNKIVPLVSLVKNKDDETDRLAELRDTLLPKLMSGELKVTNMDLVNEMLEKGIR